MLRLLVDTCVWLGVVKDHRQKNTLSVLEELIRLGEASLIVPTVVLAEFERHKARIVDESRRSLSTVFKRVKEAVEQFGDPTTKGVVLQHLNEMDHQLPLLGEAAVRSVVRIEKLLSAAVPTPASDATPRSDGFSAENGTSSTPESHGNSRPPNMACSGPGKPGR
jgi:hypothetical protein